MLAMDLDDVIMRVRSWQARERQYRKAWGQMLGGDDGSPVKAPRKQMPEAARQRLTEMRNG